MPQAPVMLNWEDFVAPNGQPWHAPNLTWAMIMNNPGVWNFHDLAPWNFHDLAPAPAVVVAQIVAQSNAPGHN
jgi:hypothetical protein